MIAVVAMNSNLLHQYQKDRLTSFMDPTHDAQGAAYNVNQARTTIASGGLGGRGLFHGPMTQLHFVPEQHTDFIFTAVGEELGFVGSAVVLGLFGVLIWRVLRGAHLARDRFGSLLCGGVVVVLTFQIFENVGMAVGIMPVTGIPLPLLSYGGSSALTTLLLVGLVLNVGMNRYRSPRYSGQP